MRSFQPLAGRGYALMLACVALLMAGSSAAFAGLEGHASWSPGIAPDTHITTVAAADHDHDHRSGHETDHDDAKSQHPEIDPQQAARRARQRFGGRVLNVVLEHGPGGPYYRVKILKRGRVRVVDIDARR